LPLELPQEKVFYADDWNIDELFDPVIGFIRRATGRRRWSEAATVSGKSSGAVSSRNESKLREFLRQHYYALLRIPDARIGWRRNAVTAGRHLMASWRPDLIFASAPPVTGLFVAAALGREFGIPWIAELRDLWTDNPYYGFPAWRKALDRILERRLLRTAGLLVTVTPLWGRTLELKYDKPVTVALNGYAEEDFPALETNRSRPPERLRIVYTGNIYVGFRDPSSLFAAIAKLPADQRASVVVDFYGASVDSVRGLVERFGVADCVGIHAPIAYRESLRVQMDADVLLLLQWNDPRDAGNIPAKFFEYIAARRPILFLGYEQGTLAQMIKERGAGLVSNSPELIAAQLSEWIAKRRSGDIAAVDEKAKLGLSRQEQFQKLDAVLANFLAQRSA
jgi:hypothetical protein